MKLWTKIKNWITKPYMKPLKLKKEWEIDIKGLKNKTKKELEKLGRKVGIELDRRLTKDKLINKLRNILNNANGNKTKTK